MIEIGVTVPPNYSLAIAARAAKARQARIVAAAVYDDGILSPRRGRSQRGPVLRAWRSPAFIETSAIEFFFGGCALTRISGAAIIAAVETSFGLVKGDLLTRQRTESVSTARHAATWLIWKYSAPSISRAGLVLDRHHTTSMHSLRRCRELLREDISFQLRVARIVAWLQPFSSEQHYGGA